LAATHRKRTIAFRTHPAGLGSRENENRRMDGATMISEKAFAQHYTSTWRLLAPATDLFVRKINLGLYEREFPVFESSVAPRRRGFINEIAFNVYCTRLLSHRKEEAEAFDEAIVLARAKVAGLKSMKDDDLISLDQAELSDCREQVRRLQSFFAAAARGNAIENAPKFRGAGLIDSCEGDLFFNKTLFEIKAGLRNFRAIDIKQMLIYATLNQLEGARDLITLGLFNPRMGISFQDTLDNVCLEVSGCKAAELLPEIGRVICSGDISR
jgi:hypothetical protein